jgi:hypothetical protein
LAAAACTVADVAAAGWLSCALLLWDGCGAAAQPTAEQPLYMSINLGQSGSLEPSFPFYRKKAILRATHLFLRRSAGPLSSGVLVGGRDERSARLLGGRACIAVGSRSSSFCIPPASSISPARVRVLVQLSGDNGFGGFVSGEICMRYVCRVCRGGFASLRLPFPGDAGAALVVASQGNKISWSLPRPFSVPLRRQWWD